MSTVGFSPQHSFDRKSMTETPRAFRKPAENILEIRTGGGWVSIFGSFFLVGGVLMLLGASGLLGMDNLDQIGSYIAAAMGVVFFVVGTLLTFGRTWIHLERSENRILKLRGLIVPMLRQEFQLSEYQTVSISHDTGDSDSPERFPVSLRAADGHYFALTSGVEYGAACREAAYVAEFLGWQVEDRTTSTVRRESSVEMRLDLGERLDRDDSVDDWVSQPYAMRSRIDRSSGSLKITVPSEPFKLWKQFPTLIPVGFVMFVYWQISEEIHHPNTPSVVADWFEVGVFLLLVGLPALTIGCAILKSRLGYSQLMVNNRELSITTRKAFLKQIKRIGLPEIRDIDFSSSASLKTAAKQAATSEYQGQRSGKQLPRAAAVLINWAAKYIRSRGIVIKSNQGLINFGGGLPDDEVAFLAHTLRRWLRDHS